MVYVAVKIYMKIHCTNLTLMSMIICLNLTVIAYIINYSTKMYVNVKKRNHEEIDTYFITYTSIFPAVFFELSIILNLNNWISYYIKIKKAGERNRLNHNSNLFDSN